MTSTVEKTATKERAETVIRTADPEWKRAAGDRERDRQKVLPAPKEAGRAGKDKVEETATETDKK